MKRIAFFLSLFLLLPAICLADVGEDADVYRIVDEEGQTLTYYAGTPEQGDEYIAGDNRHFRIASVSEKEKTASAKLLGTFELPQVNWLTEDAHPVSAEKKAVALYCTHSDESYKSGDGSSSLAQRGGIYDVAEAFKSALEKEGITVYYSDENHFPHDAGAYRRSRGTAASLAENGVDAILDIHRDGIPDAGEYEKTLNGQDISKVRLLVGRSNQNAEANKAFAAQIKAVADQAYPGLIKDIYIGKGTYNQDLMSQAVLMEFGTYTSEKDDVLHSTGYMADVMNKTLYGSVKGAAKGAENKNAGAWKGIGWLLAVAAVGALVFAFISTGRGKDAMQQWKRTFQEMTGGLTGRKKDE